jgi:hypothetical protein
VKPRDDEVAIDVAGVYVHSSAAQIRGSTPALGYDAAAVLSDGSGAGAADRPDRSAGLEGVICASSRAPVASGNPGADGDRGRVVLA